MSGTWTSWKSRIENVVWTFWASGIENESRIVIYGANETLEVAMERWSMMEIELSVSMKRLEVIDRGCLYSGRDLSSRISTAQSSSRIFFTVDCLGRHRHWLGPPHPDDTPLPVHSVQFSDSGFGILPLHIRNEAL